MHGGNDQVNYNRFDVPKKLFAKIGLNRLDEDRENMADDKVSAPGTPRFEFVSNPEEISALMERARCQQDDGSRLLDAEAML